MIPLSLLWIGLLDTSGQGRGTFENRWLKGDFVAGTNDTVATLKEAGDVAAIQIAGPGESCLLRRKRFTLETPCRVRFRIRATPAKFGESYPAVHAVFDPPALEDPWWKNPVEGTNAGQGRWRDGRTGFVFHFSTTQRWRRFGLSASLEEASGQHAYSPPRGAWVVIQITLEPKRIRVEADGVEVAGAEADLASVRTFAAGFGDQGSTLVELDELRVIPGKR